MREGGNMKDQTSCKKNERAERRRSGGLGVGAAAGAREAH
jgi:hypothetical protein